MTLTDLRDWLKTMDLAEHYAVGRMNQGEEKSLGVFDRTGGGAPILALGGAELSSYGVRRALLRLRWNRNAAETESAARRLWQAVYRAAHVDLPGGGRIQFVQPLTPGPRAGGRTEDGLYEYEMEINIYFRR